MMPTKIATNGRMLKRCTLKEDRPKEGFKAIPSMATRQCEDKAMCEITSIKTTQRHLKKEAMLPSQNDAVDGIIPSLNLPDGGIHGSLRKVACERAMRASSPVTIGLSDLGPNARFSIPTRPATTGRMLPHISRRHFHKESMSLLNKSSLYGEAKKATNNTKPALDMKDIRKDFTAEKARSNLKLSGQSGEAATDVKQTPQCISSMNLRRQQNIPPSVLNSNNLQPLAAIRRPTAPPQQRAYPKPAKQSDSNDPKHDKERSASSYQSRDKWEPISSDELPTQSITISTKINQNQTKINRPMSNFKQIMSARNLQRTDDKPSEMKQPAVPSANRATRSLQPRPLQGKERDLRLRKTHPPFPKEASNGDLPTLTRGRQLRNEKL